MIILLFIKEHLTLLIHAVLQIRIRIQGRFFPDPVSLIRAPTHISESLMTIIWVKTTIILCHLAQILSVRYLLNFWLKKVRQQSPPPPLLLWPRSEIWDAGFRMNKKLGSGISIQDQQRRFHKNKKIMCIEYR
jgi:hypothetical protein